MPGTEATASLTGRIDRGIVNTGDQVDIVGMGEGHTGVVVTGVEMFRKTLDEGQAGDNAGSFVAGLARCLL